MKWDLTELREAIVDTHDCEQQLLIEPSLDSLDLRIRFAQYHLSELKRLDPKNYSESEFFRFGMDYLSATNEHNISNKYKGFVFIANTVACYQNLHASLDILGHVIFFGLGMNLNDNTNLTKSKITLNTVSRKLGKNHFLPNEINKFLETSSIKFLMARTNRSKHCSMDKLGIKIWSSNDKTGFIFQDFRHKGLFYKRRFVISTLELLIKEISFFVVTVGRRINQEVCN